MLTETQASDALADLADELGQPCWRDLIEKDDRTGPEDYPDHCLITQDELIEYIKVSLDMAMDPKALPRLMWRAIGSAPLDGTTVDIWVDGHRVPDAWYGRPNHECGEAGQYCDSCPSYDAWCDMHGYITGKEGWADGDPSHYVPLAAAPDTTDEIHS